MLSIEEKTKRINELYHKSQTPEGLTPEEKVEQYRLRQEYIASVRANLRGQLDQVNIQNEDGSITELSKKYNPKVNLREKHLELRDSQSIQDINEKSAQICNLFTKTELYKEADIVLCYVSIRSEVDTTPLISKALADKKEVYCPKVEDDKLHFYKIRDFEDLSKGTYGILEPIQSKNEFLGIKDKKVINIIPGVAFDFLGYRIGYGKGYYDRYLSEYKEYFTSVGMAYDFQMVSTVFRDSFDEHLNYIAMQSQVFEVGKGE